MLDTKTASQHNPNDFFTGLGSESLVKGDAITSQNEKEGKEHDSDDDEEDLAGTRMFMQMKKNEQEESKAGVDDQDGVDLAQVLQNNEHNRSQEIQIIDDEGDDEEANIFNKKQSEQMGES